MPKAIVIVNPSAGRGAGTSLRPSIVSMLQSRDYDYDLVDTKGPGHAIDLARDAAERGREAVIAVGGDGTVNEVINGLLQFSETAVGPSLGVLPIGTGNDFAFGTGLPLELAPACDVIARGRVRVIDAGWAHAEGAESRYYGNGLGMGFDAVANIEASKIRRLRGYLLYLAAVFRTLAFYYQIHQVKIRMDDEEIEQPSMMISIMNGRRLGGAFIMTPDARDDDGWLDLCVAHRVDRLTMVAFVPRFMRGTHVTDRRVAIHRARRVAITSDTPLAAHIDGEIYSRGTLRVETKLLPQCLRLIC